MRPAAALSAARTRVICHAGRRALSTDHAAASYGEWNSGGRKPGRCDLQPADHRIAPPYLDEVTRVVVEGQQARRLQPDRGQVTRAVHGGVHAVVVLPQLDADLTLVPAVETEREPHGAVEPAARAGTADRTRTGPIREARTHRAGRG